MGQDNLPIKHWKKKCTENVSGTGWKVVLHVVVSVTNSELWGRVGKGTNV